MQQVPTSANIVVVPCKKMQHVGPNNVACCRPTMLHPFAQAFEEFVWPARFHFYLGDKIAFIYINSYLKSVGCLVIVLYNSEISF